MGTCLSNCKMKTFVILTTLVVSVLSKDLYLGKHKTRIFNNKGADQFLDCYDYQNQGGNKLRAIDYIPALSGYRFDNRISSCCITGVWLLYADQNYNSGNTGAANWWVYGDNYCVNVPSGFDNKASSLRYTGAPDSWTSDTLNLYLNQYFVGEEEYTYDDAHHLNYNDQARSLIVTGCSAWTLYTKTNFEGSCKCVWPSDTSKCFPGFYSTEKSLGFMSKAISSVKKGCHCGFSALPDNHGVKSLENGASGYFGKIN